MPRDEAAELRLRVGLVLCFAVALATWWGLDRLSSRANWLQVEASRFAIVGQPLQLRIRLAPMAEAAFLTADLHWTTNRNSSEGLLSTGGTQAVGKEGGVFEFAIAIPPRNGLRFVNGVIFLSRSGDWQTRTRVAETKFIPAVTNATSGADAGLVRLRMVPLDEDTNGHPPPTTLPRLLTGLVFLLAAAMALAGLRQPEWSPLSFLPWRRESPAAKAHVAAANETPARGSGRSGSGSGSGVRMGWSWLALGTALGLACLWELLGLEHWLGAKTRALAQARDWYYSREVFQKSVISLVVAAVAASLLLLRRLRSSRRLLSCCFAIYLGISAVNLMSLHAIDVVADNSFLRVPLIQALALRVPDVSAAVMEIDALLGRVFRAHFGDVADLAVQADWLEAIFRFATNTLPPATERDARIPADDPRKPTAGHHAMEGDLMWFAWALLLEAASVLAGGDDESPRRVLMLAGVAIGCPAHFAWRGHRRTRSDYIRGDDTARLLRERGLAWADNFAAAVAEVHTLFQIREWGDNSPKRGQS